MYVVAHKKITLALPDGYKIIQVNAEKNGQQKFADYWDNVGEDNISRKNLNFCELTALYWIWKNDLKSNYIGLTHYRRFFFTQKCKNIFLDHYIFPVTADFRKSIDASHLGQLLDGYDIILPRKEYFRKTIKGQYIAAHSKKDFMVLEKIVKEMYPGYSKSFDTVMNGYKMYRCNMFITSRKIFSDYMKWLMSILFEVEKHITISSNPYQARVFGFMSERLLNLYVYHNHLRVKNLPIIFLDDNVKKATWARKSYHTMLADMGILSWY